MNEFTRQWELVGDAAMAALKRVGSRGWYILGQEVQKFEAALAKLWTLEHAVGVANGMDAIEIALRAAGLKPGEKVLTTPLTAFATTLAVVRAGGIPVFVDVDSNGQLDLALARKYFEQNRDTRFLLPVHLYLLSLDLDALEKLTKDFNLITIEDCAQSILATHGGRRAGTVGLAATTSFYPTKNLGALGDGGALICNDKTIAEKARMLRNYGQTTTQYEHVEQGLNSRLDELHAAILLDALLPQLNTWTQTRRSTAFRYLKAITNPRLTTLKPAKHVEPAWHIFALRVAEGGREAFRKHLREKHVSTAVHYPTLVPDQPALVNHGRFEVVGDLANARSFAQNEVSIPIHPFLSDIEIETIIEACQSWTA